MEAWIQRIFLIARTGVLSLSVPALSVPALSVPLLSVPLLSVPLLSVPLLSVPLLSVLLLSVLLLSVLSQPVQAQDTPVLDRIITPDMERRVIEEDILDVENFEVGLYGGSLSIEDFGSNNVGGIRLAYHATEDAFWEIAYAQSTLRATSFERLSGSAPLLTDDQRKLRYYNISLGYNLFPGEVFIGKNWAFNTAFYLIAGAGSTSFADEEHFTFNFGAGLRFFLTDWIAMHGDMREYVFTHDLLGKDQTTQNLEASFGFTVFF